MGLGARIWKKLFPRQIPDPGGEKARDTGSRIRIRNTIYRKMGFSFCLKEVIVSGLNPDSHGLTDPD
jgi:hypothetical protein